MKDRITCNNIDVATVTEEGYKLFNDEQVEECLQSLDCCVCSRNRISLLDVSHQQLG